MRIWPSAAVKNITDCEPGELVQLKGWSELNWALVAKDKEDFYLIMLTGAQLVAPRVSSIGQAIVLSFGKDYEIMVDLDGLKEMPASRNFERCGCLMLSESSWYLRAIAPDKNGWYGTACYSFTSGTFVGEPSSNTTAVFGSWQLRLPALNNSGESQEVLAISIAPMA